MIDNYIGLAPHGDNEAHLMQQGTPGPSQMPLDTCTL